MISKGSNQSIVKKANTKLIKETIYRHAPISRVEISQMLGLTPPTVATNVNKLIADDIVYELGTSPSHTDALGRKPILVDFIADSRMAVGVELGPYRTTLVLTDLRGKIVMCCEAVAAPSGYGSMLAFVADEVKKLLGKANVRNVRPEKLLGLGIGLPGFIDSDSGVIRDCFRHNWVDQPLAADTTRVTGLQTHIENNVRARAIGAELFNREMSADNFIYFFVSHGLACPLIIKENPFTGRTAGTGEIGHMVVCPGGPKCDTCGNDGCLEALASESAIVKRCAGLVQRGLPTMLTQLCADPQHPEIEEILTAQECGDVYVGGILKDAINYLGIGLANLINFIRPDPILIDGKILGSRTNQEMLMEATRINVFGMGKEDLNMVFLPYDRNRGAVGGAAIAVIDFLKSSSEE